MLARKVGTGTVLIVLLLLCIPAANAQGLPLATGEWAPWTSAGLENYGEFTERVTIVLKEMGMEPDYAFYPWRRCFDSVIKGRVWAAFPYSYTEERAKQVWYSDMLACSRTVFFYYDRGGPPARYRFDRLEDLKPYRIGGVTGYFYEEAFKAAGLQIDYANKEINSIEKLMVGRIDLVPVNERVGWDLIKTRFADNFRNFHTLEKPLSVKPLRLIVSKDYPDSKRLFDRFNQALQSCAEKGLVKIEECDPEFGGEN